MSTTTFRREAKKQVTDLLFYWKEIERWIKSAEQVNKRAIIPAINELRYASRQLYYGINLLTKPKLTEGEVSSIRKRLIIADQYLMNADHDVVDAITTFYSKIVADLDCRFGITQISNYFTGYPAFRSTLREVEREISRSRHDATERKVAYKKLRQDVLPKLIEQYQLLEDSEVLANHAKQALEAEVVRYRRESAISRMFNIVCGVATLASTGLSFYLWHYPLQTLENSEEVAAAEQPEVAATLSATVRAASAATNDREEHPADNQ